MRKIYTVVWHYIGNHGVVTLQADSAEQAVEKIRTVYDSEFKLKGALFAFEGHPAHVHTPEKYPETAHIQNWSWA